MNGLIISCLENDLQEFSLMFPRPIEINDMNKICKLINDYFDGKCGMDKPPKIKWDIVKSHEWIILPNLNVVLITKFKIKMKDIDGWIDTN